MGRSLFSPLVVLTVFLLDRLTKYWVQRNMIYGDTYGTLPFFQFTYIENTGAAFGMGQNQNTALIGISLALIVILFIYGRKIGAGNLRAKIGLALIVGGALGNLFDRIAYGAVVDFLDFFVGDHHWPAFNVADSSICVGAVMLALFRWKTKSEGQV